MALSSDVEYLNSRDATIMGSRNGHAPIYLWYTLTRKGYEGMRRDVERCMRNAHVLKTVRRAARGATQTAIYLCLGLQHAGTALGCGFCVGADLARLLPLTFRRREKWLLTRLA